MKKRLVEWIVSRLIFLVHQFLCLTIRWELLGDFDDWKKRPHLLVLWHARLLMIPYLNRNWNWNGIVMISEHRDGELIAEAARLMGVDSARGSSTRGGARAFLEMVRLARGGRSLALTSDGPKGPREVVQPGTALLAKKSGLPIRAVCYAAKRQWRVNSWDRFYIPKPFSKGVFVLSDEVYADSGDDQVDLERIQTVMDETQRRADSYFAVSPDLSS
ncbi:MAG: lysophospholipid acyltransferase family protein [Mariprofundaceae bacterium]